MACHKLRPRWWASKSADSFVRVSTSTPGLHEEPFEGSVGPTYFTW